MLACQILFITFSLNIYLVYGKVFALLWVLKGNKVHLMISNGISTTFLTFGPV